MKPKTPQLTYLTEGNRTFVLADITDRPKDLEQPNFKATGKALVRIVVDCKPETNEGLKTAEIRPKRDGRYSEHKNNHKWGKEDLSLQGTTTIIQRT